MTLILLQRHADERRPVTVAIGATKQKGIISLLPRRAHTDALGDGQLPTARRNFSALAWQTSRGWPCPPSQPSFGYNRFPPPSRCSPCQTAPKCQSLGGPFLPRGVSVGNTANPPSSKALTFYRATMELLRGGLGGDIYYFISSQRVGACVCWRPVRGSLTSSAPPRTAACTGLTLSNRKCCRMLTLRD